MARVCVDSTYFEVNGSGLLTFKPGSVGLQQMLTYTTPGVFNFTKATYPGLRLVRVRVVGGGGGGAGAAITGGGTSIVHPSASGGGYSESILAASGLGASESITVGLGGAGSVSNVNGGNGGTSSFGGFVTAPGGIGAAPWMLQGSFDYVTGGTPPGALGTGQIRTTGAPGGPGHRSQGGTIIQGGDGGMAGGGLGAGGNANTQQMNGFPGSGYGGGGSSAGSTGGTMTGGMGANGAVFVELYY